MKNLDKNIYEKLPEILVPVFNIEDDPKINEIKLMSILTGLSACMPNVFSHYANKRHYAHIYTIILALSASDKRYMEIVLPFLEKLDDYHSELCKNELDQYNKLSKKEKLNSTMPDITIKILPGDISTSALIHFLKVNPNGMIMFETEAITIGKQLRQHTGSFTDILLKCFANERISKITYSNARFDKIKKPKLSILASGTLKQITQIMENAEDGLFGRICFLKYSTYDPWSNVNYLPPNHRTTSSLDLLGDKLVDINKILISNNNAIEIHITENQKNLYNDKMSIIHNEYLETCSELIPTVRRIGIIHLRICMILTVIRKLDYILENEEFRFNPNEKLDFECEDIDFENSLEIILFLLKNSEMVLEEFKGMYNFKTEKERRLFESLPVLFTTSMALNSQFHTSERTTKAYLNTWRQKKLINRLKQGNYEKIYE